MKAPVRHKSFVQVCMDCGERENIVEDYKSGYYVCGSCGCTVGNRIIDEGGEWRSFGDSNRADPTRTGSAGNPFLEAEQLDTMISAGSGMNSYTLSKIQMKNSMRGPERALKHGLNLITAFCERANISKTIIDRAHYIFKNIEEKKLLKGKNIEGVVGACIYIACRQEECPRTFKEISVMTGVQKREIGRSFKLISPHLDKITTMSTGNIIARFCSDLNLSIKIQKVATEISNAAHESGCLAGKSPDSIAAAVIYMVTNLFPDEKKVQKDIQFVTNVTEVTIKNTYKELLSFKYDIIPEGLVPKTAIDKLPNY
jgi:transcription initiation factor TFIIB